MGGRPGSAIVRKSTIRMVARVGYVGAEQGEHGRGLLLGVRLGDDGADGLPVLVAAQAAQHLGLVVLHVELEQREHVERG